MNKTFLCFSMPLMSLIAFNFSNNDLDKENTLSNLYLEAQNNPECFDFNNYIIKNYNFEGKNLNGFNFDGWTLINVKFPNVDLRETEFDGAKLEDIDLEGAFISDSFKFHNISPLNLLKSYHYFNLIGKELEAQKLNKIIKPLKMNLSGEDLSGLNLKGIKLGDCNLEDAYLDRINLSKADLQGANLQKCSLVEADLSFSNLREANLCDANLESADLKLSVLTNAKLQNTNLEFANLYLSNLEGSNLNGANLTGASLKNCIIKRTNISDTILSSSFLNGKNNFWREVSLSDSKSNREKNHLCLSLNEKIQNNHGHFYTVKTLPYGIQKFYKNIRATKFSGIIMTCGKVIAFSEVIHLITHPPF